MENFWGGFQNTSHIYLAFKEVLSAHLLASERMAEANTVSMVAAVVPYCFRPAPTAIPSDV